MNAAPTVRDDTSGTFKPVRLDFRAELEQAMSRPGFKEAWGVLEEEYATLAALLAARRDAGLKQDEVAARMGATKSAVSRLEASLRSDKESPSFATLREHSHPCGKRLVMRMVLRVGSSADQRRVIRRMAARLISASATIFSLSAARLWTLSLV